jgi:hypothetical protein
MKMQTIRLAFVLAACEAATIFGFGSLLGLW